jgi:3-deoxy-D-manno-octulosonic-acid transferase
VYWVYSLLLFLVLVAYSPLYFVRMRLRQRESMYISRRLGLRLPVGRTAGRSIWVHAVSVGEVLSLRNLVARIKREHPEWAVYFSTLTDTGYRIAREKLREADQIFLVPLDFAWVVRRFFRALEPDLMILAESEFWPNLLRVAHRRSGGVLLINGRMSAGSFKRYQRLKPLTRKILQNIDGFLVQTEQDRQRLMGMGLAAGKIQVAGNLKADISLPTFTPADLANLRRAVGVLETQRIIVAGSTHRGEEETLLRAYRRAASRATDLRMLLAPRHPLRSEEVERAAAELGLRVSRRTRKPQGEWQVLIIDTIGELGGFYAIADMAFIGGSLVPHGGQNLLEPAFYGKPILFGPHMENFAALAAEFVGRSAARVVAGEDDLADAFWLGSRGQLREMGERAAAVLASLQGATEKTLLEIERRLADRLNEDRGWNKMPRGDKK